MCQFVLMDRIHGVPAIQDGFGPIGEGNIIMADEDLSVSLRGRV